MGLRGRSQVLSGVALVLLSSFAFAVTPALVRLAYRAKVNELSLITFRCIIAAAALAAISQLVGEALVGAPAVRRLIALGALLFAPQMWLYFLSLRYLETSVAVAIVYVYPVGVAVLVAVLHRCLPRPVEMLLLGVALCGVMVITVFDRGHRASTIGLVLAGATALGYALYVVAADSLVRSLPPLAASGWVVVGTGLSTLIVAMLTNQLERPTTGSGWSFVLLHGLVIVPVGLGCFYAGLARLGATKASIVDTSQPAIAAVAGVWVLGERLAAVQVVGIALVTLAVLGLPLLTGFHARRSRLINARDATSLQPP